MLHTPRLQGEACLSTESRYERVAPMCEHLAWPPWRFGRSCKHVPRGCHAVGLDKSDFIEGLAYV
jgi:hypothetical protein